MKVFKSKAFGETITVIESGAENGGARLVLEAVYTPNQTWESGTPHYHPYQDEEITVLAGMLSVRINGREQTFVTGETVTIPRGTIHEMRNLGSIPVRTSWIVSPALNTEQFMETVWGLSEEGTLMHPLQYAVVAQAYDDVFRLVQPPRLLQKLLFPPLALLGRLLGYKAAYPHLAEASVQLAVE